MRRPRRLAVGAASVLVAAAAWSAVPKRTPTVKEVGATSVKYSGPEAEGVLSYRFAADNLGSDWLLLELALTGTGDPVEVSRARIVLHVPSGEDIPLAGQAEYATSYSDLAPMLARADIAAEPLDYWAGRRDNAIPFFSAPGQSLVFPSFWITDREVYSGRLAFYLPGGVQPGPYELRIRLLESEVRMPFRLGGR